MRSALTPSRDYRSSHLSSRWPTWYRQWTSTLSGRPPWYTDTGCSSALRPSCDDRSSGPSPVSVSTPSLLDRAPRSPACYGSGWPWTLTSDRGWRPPLPPWNREYVSQSTGAPYPSSNRNWGTDYRSTCWRHRGTYGSRRSDAPLETSTRCRPSNLSADPEVSSGSWTTGTPGAVGDGRSRSSSRQSRRRVGLRPPV